MLSNDMSMCTELLFNVGGTTKDLSVTKTNLIITFGLSI